LIDRRFRRRWKNYLYQCGLSTLALLIIFLVVDVVLRAAIVVAIASTAFIVFVIPHSAASSPQRVIGGQVVAVIVGTTFSALYLLPVLGELAEGSHIARDIFATISVGLSILLMVVTNTEHPPAAGTALGLVVSGWDPSGILFVLFGAIMLSSVHMLLRPRLTNLL
jgi:CBS-domain-containing membrane protein